MRELSVAVETIKNSQQFTYFDVAEIHLPFGPGDITPRVLFVATAEIEVLPSLDFAAFANIAFVGALARVPTSAERGDWVDALQTAYEISEAALLTEAQGLIDDLFTSAEYIARDRSDNQFVEDLYQAFLGRIHDEAGMVTWLEALETETRAFVRAGFYNSVEFANRVSLLSEPASFESDTREMGDLAFSDGAATDGVEFSLTNAENTYSDLIGQPGRRLYPASAVVSRAFKLDDGTFEKVEMIVGLARFTSADGENAKVAIFSDLDRRGVDVVEMVPQHCIHIYKGPGCDSPDASPTCSRILNDATNGCASKDPAPQIEDAAPPDNRPSFKGLPQEIIPVITTAPTGVGIPPGEAGPGGWPDRDYDPFDPSTGGRMPYLSA